MVIFSTSTRKDKEKKAEITEKIVKIKEEIKQRLGKGHCPKGNRLSAI